MKSHIRKLVSAVGFVGAMGAGASAYATPILIDTGVDGDFDGNSFTDDFSFFTGSQLQPTSIYYDSDMSGGITTGDLVVDVAAGFIGQLNPLGFGSSREGFNNSWALEVDWFLVGTAVVADGGDPVLDPGETLIGNFFGGEVGLEYSDGGLGATTAGPGFEVEIDVESSNIEVGNNIDVQVRGTVTMANDFVQFAQGQFAGESFGDIVANPSVDINALISTNLREADKAPVLAPAGNLTAYFDALTDPLGNDVYTTAQATEIAGAIADFEASAGITGLFDRYIRTTSLDSAELRFEVPAPATLGLLGLGLIGLGRRMRKAA